MGHHNTGTQSSSSTKVACGAPFYNFVASQGYDGIATVQEKNQAEAAAVGTQGKRDRCMKGKSCGAACIYYRKDCILELPETVQEPLTRVRNMLEEAVAKGQLTDDEAGSVFQKRLGMTDDIKWGREDLTAPQNAKTMQAAAARMKKDADEMDSAREVIRRESKSEKEYQEKIDRIHDIMYGSMGALKREKVSEITPEGLEFAQKRKAVFEKGDEIMAQSSKDFKAGTLTAKEMNERMAPVAEVLKPYKGQYSDAEIEYAKKIVTSYEKSFMETAGSLKEGGGFFQKNKAIPEEYGNLEHASAAQKDARFTLGTKALLEQGGRDAYSGQRTSILNMDWEHFIPFESVKKFAEVENNFYLTASRINGGKAGKPPTYMVDTKNGLPSKLSFNEKGSLTPESRDKWSKSEAKVLGAQMLKKAGFEGAYYQAGVKALREITGSAMFSSLPADAKLAVLNKIVYGGLLTKVPTLAETAGGGIQSSGRGDKRWYFYGKENPDFAKAVFKKYMDLYERGDDAGLAKLGGILRRYSDDLNPTITARIPSNHSIKMKSGENKPAVKIGDETTGQVRQIMNEMNASALKEIDIL
jgi:hypothetical protein